ncbi:MAG: DUF2007 domain-containing protein [Planctomycetota bacterium]|nr:MAG: DUF2007 domain-containing protein [Planctomycetota bacterium]
MDDKLVTMAQYTNPAEASLAKQILADFGIESVLTGENFSVIYPVPSLANVELQVLQCEAKRAREILESNKKSANAWRCLGQDKLKEQ